MGMLKRCFTCQLRHSRAPAAVIGVIDLVVWSLPLLQGANLFFSLKSDTLSTAWLALAASFFLLHLAANVANWYGLASYRSEFMLPKLFVKLVTVVFCFAVLGFVAVCLQQGSGWMVDILMSSANLDYRAASMIIHFASALFFFGAILITVLQIWFFAILYSGYKEIREIQICMIIDRVVRKNTEQRSNGTCLPANNNNNNNRPINNNNKQVDRPRPPPLPARTVEVLSNPVEEDDEEEEEEEEDEIIRMVEQNGASPVHVFII